MQLNAEPVPYETRAPLIITLPYPPSANRYWRHRVMKVKGQSLVHTYISEDGQAFKDAVKWILRAAGVRHPCAGRVRVHIQLWPHRPLDWKKREKADPLYWADSVQRLDLDNTRKAVNDALKGLAFGDDKMIWSDAGDVMEPDGRKACVVVTITPLVKVQPQAQLEIEACAV